MNSKGVQKLSELRSKIHLWRMVRWIAGLLFILLCIAFPLVPHKELADLIRSNGQFGMSYYLAFFAIIALLAFIYNKEFGGISISKGHFSIILFFIIIATFITVSPTIIYLVGNEYITSYFRTNKSSYELLLLFLGFTSLVVFLWSWRQITELSLKEKKHRNKLISNGYLNREVPITDKAGDLFGFQERAAFLAQQVELGQNILITGEWGSGKSSLCNLITNELQKNSDIKTVICKINCWGNRIQNFDETLLNSILFELKQHSDTFFVSNVPSMYMNGFRSSDNWLKNLIGFILPNRIPPHEVLSQLDSMLIHNKIRIVIIVEDADRNENKEFINEVVAPMLDSLNHLINIKFLFTITEGSIEQNHEMISRIVAFKHTIIPPSGKFYILELYKFVMSLINNSADVILPNEENTINRLFGKFEDNHSPDNLPYDLDENLSRIDRIIDSEVSMAYYLTSTIKSYRDFKFVLRDIEFRWNQIKGQVDLCDLIAFRMLEKFDIKIYGFVVNLLNGGNIEDEMESYEENLGKKKKKSNEEKYFGNSKINFEHRRFNKIIYFFENADKSKNPQAVALKEDKYHLRVLLDCIPQGENTGDQAIFKILQSFELGEINLNFAIQKLYSLTNDEEFVRLWDGDLSKFKSYQLVAEFIGRYGYILSQITSRLNLLRELIFIISDVKIKTGDWGFDNTTNKVFYVLLEYYNKDSNHKTEISNCIYEMLEISYKRNLLVFFRFYRCIINGHNIPNEIADKLKSFMQTIIQVWNKDPIMLIKASPFDDIWAISRLSYIDELNKIPWGKLFMFLTSKGLSKEDNDILMLQFIGYFISVLDLIYYGINKIEFQRPGEGVCYNAIPLTSEIIKIWTDIMKNAIGGNHIEEFCILFSQIDTEYLISTYFPNKTGYFQAISTIRNSRYYAGEILSALRMQENTDK